MADFAVTRIALRLHACVFIAAYFPDPSWARCAANTLRFLSTVCKNRAKLAEEPAKWLA